MGGRDMPMVRGGGGMAPGCPAIAAGAKWGGWYMYGGGGYIDDGAIMYGAECGGRPACACEMGGGGGGGGGGA